jgi:hypothetical protein
VIFHGKMFSDLQLERLFCYFYCYYPSYRQDHGFRYITENNNCYSNFAAKAALLRSFLILVHADWVTIALGCELISFSDSVSKLDLIVVRHQGFLLKQSNNSIYFVANFRKFILCRARQCKQCMKKLHRNLNQ